MNSIEERFYEIAAQEVATKTTARGIMAKAFADAGGDERQTIVLYIRLRVEQLTKEFNDEATRRQQEESMRVAEEKKRATEARRRAEDEAMKMDCPKCGHRTYRHYFRQERGDIGVFWVLLLCGGIPGIIYYAIKSGWRVRCPACKYILKERTD